MITHAQKCPYCGKTNNTDKFSVLVNGSQVVNYTFHDLCAHGKIDGNVIIFNDPKRRYLMLSRTDYVPH
jgi:glutaredoxin